MRRAWGSIGTRWMGLGLAVGLAVVTLGLTFTGRLALYINPDQAWFAVLMAVVAVVGAVWSFALPLGAEDDHGHDHGDGGHAHGHDEAGDHAHGGDGHSHGPSVGGRIGAVAGGLVASAVIGAALILPPAPLSAELAASRDTGAPPLFVGADDVMLAGADTSAFGVGQWAAVFAGAANPDQYNGTDITLTGYVAADDPGDTLRIGRLVVTHCVIDAQPASLPVADPGWQRSLAQGDWITVKGTVVTDPSGALVIDPDSVTAVDAPSDPYEY